MAIHVNTNRFGSLVCSFYKLVIFVVFKELSHIFHLPTLNSVVIFQPNSLEIPVFNTTESNSNHLVCSKQRKRSSNTSFGRNDPSSTCLNWFRRCLMIVYCLCISRWRCLIVHWMLINFIFKWIYPTLSTSTEFTMMWIIEMESMHWISFRWLFVVGFGYSHCYNYKNVITPEGNEHKTWAIKCAA